MFLKHLYRKSVQWVFQVCNMILGEGGEEESKIPFIFIFAIHPLFWNIRRKAENILFSTHQMIMDTHSKQILSQDQSKVLSKINIMASFWHMIIKTTKETKENTHQNKPKIACQMISKAPEQVTHHTGNILELQLQKQPRIPLTKKSSRAIPWNNHLGHKSPTSSPGIKHTNPLPYPAQARLSPHPPAHHAWWYARNTFSLYSYPIANQCTNYPHVSTYLLATKCITCASSCDHFTNKC